jgi:hypothetical protein
LNTVGVGKKLRKAIADSHVESTIRKFTRFRSHEREQNSLDFDPKKEKIACCISI